jgi:hypothetical protein
MFTTVALIVVCLVGLLLAYASTRPGAIHVQRAATIKASADAIFPLINDFHQWTSWSPWEKRDPALKRTYSGASSGKGATYEWEGNKQVGQGRMEITDTALPSRVRIKLDFIKPFEGHNVAEFALAPQGDSTRVTWTMDGPSRFMTKLIGVFMNMDKMIGADFETGLANLKSIAEK